MTPLRIVILGLTISSSWGNGHATTYRGLVRELANRCHDVLFLERDTPWYAANRDLPHPPYGRFSLYTDRNHLVRRFTSEVESADFVLVGSYVPEGIAVGDWALRTAQGPVGFYDIDTPVTLAKLERGDYEYLTPELIARYALYLSFSGGPILQTLEQRYGSPRARSFYCAFDPDLYFPDPVGIPQWDLGYMGTYSDDRQPTLERLLLEPARVSPGRRFAVAGPQYPAGIAWPPNVTRIEHIAPAEHRAFYCAQRFTLNVTRADMVRAGFSPSVRLFEAAACGVPIVSDYWEGLDTFFTPGSEILIAREASDVLKALNDISESEQSAIAARARARVTAEHTAAHRAAELESHIRALRTA